MNRYSRWHLSVLSLGILLLLPLPSSAQKLDGMWHYVVNGCEGHLAAFCLCPWSARGESEGCYGTWQSASDELAWFWEALGERLNTTCGGKGCENEDSGLFCAHCWDNYQRSGRREVQSTRLWIELGAVDLSDDWRSLFPPGTLREGAEIALDVYSSLNPVMVWVRVILSQKTLALDWYDPVLPLIGRALHTSAEWSLLDWPTDFVVHENIAFAILPPGTSLYEGDFELTLSIDPTFGDRFEHSGTVSFRCWRETQGTDEDTPS